MPYPTYCQAEMNGGDAEEGHPSPPEKTAGWGWGARTQVATN